jgi:predicted nuclease of restriction endonuclease-like RecB superfamily
LLPRALLHVNETQGRIVPHYLLAADWPWLQALIEEYERYVGRRRAELDRRLREPLPVPCPLAKLRLARRVLDRIWPDECQSPMPPRRARALAFGRAAAGAPSEAVLAGLARELATTPEAIRECLFADLPGERRLSPRPPVLSASDLALRTNLAQVQSLLASASRVIVDFDGNARDVVRHAKLHGLICTAVPADAQPATEAPSGAPSRSRLEISGPFALFRRTTLYARALAGLIPRLAWCRRFVLRAECALGERRPALVLRTGDPIFPAERPRLFDSRVEERFAREFCRLATDWILVREPEAVAVDGTLVFPDFALQHRSDERRRWLLEIVGFWTADYVRSKLDRLRRARVPNLILCLDADRNCGSTDLPPGTPVIRFRRRIDPRLVLSTLERP